MKTKNIRALFYKDKIKRKNTKLKNLRKTVETNQQRIYEFIMNATDCAELESLRNHLREKTQREVERTLEDKSEFIPLRPPKSSRDAEETVESVASSDEIRNIYKECCRMLHPDKCGSTEEATERFKRFQQACERGDIATVVDVIDNSGIDYELDEYISKLFKIQYKELKERLNTVKNAWQLGWKDDAEYGEKLEFCLRLAFD
jgi:uncharacterized membrane protein YgaE (UPF0421/DUF939 family)